MDTWLYIITPVLFVLVCLPIAAQIYFGKKRLKKQTGVPLYQINLSAILLMAFMAYGSTVLVLVILPWHFEQRDSRLFCTFAGMIYAWVGYGSVFLGQPLIALYFYVQSKK